MLRQFIKNIIDSLILLESYFVKSEKHNKKRVLILRKDTLGDYILFYPTLKYYREFYKDTEITLVVTKLFQGLSPLLSSFDNIIYYDAKKYSSNFFYRRKFLLDLKRKGFDIVIQTTFSREATGDFMMKITRAKTIVGVNGDLTAQSKTEKEKGDKFYTDLINIPENIILEIEKNKYVAEYIIKEKVEINFPTINTGLFSNHDAETIINENKLENKKYVIVFPGSGTTFKIWPKEKFAQVIDYFIGKGITSLLCGSNGEKELIDSILEKVENKEAVINLVGKTDLQTIMFLLKNSVLYFGSDTGIAHLSAAIETPTICIMGGGHFGRFFPYGDLNRNKIVFDKDMKCMGDNWACSKNLKSGESSPCIQNIKIEDAVKEIDELLKVYG